jgi:hypothetical protein
MVTAEGELRLEQPRPKKHSSENITLDEQAKYESQKEIDQLVYLDTALHR